MADAEVKKILKDFSCQFGKEFNELKFDFDKVPSAYIGKNEVQGLRNLVSQFSNSVNPEQDIIQDQWIEYALVHMGNTENSKEMLKDLNDYIVDKVYFVGNQIGPVDVLLYYLLYSAMDEIKQFGELQKRS